MICDLRLGSSPPCRQRGIALIAVLLLLVFILTIVGGLFYRHQIHIQKVTRGLVGEQALLFLLSAESWAQTLLAEDARNSSVDHSGENWARQLPVLPVEGGYIRGCLKDLQASFNINSLAWYTNKSWDDEQAAELLAGSQITTRRTLLRNLMEASGVDSGDARIAALVDWLDTDAWLVSPDSAEDNEYLLLDPPYRPANQGFVELGELSLVQGFGPQDVIQLAPWVSTLADTEAKVNVNTAPATVLMALVPSLGEEGARALIELRPFDSRDEFYAELAALVGSTGGSIRNRLPADLVAVSSDYFSLLSEVELAGVHMAYSSVIHREGAETSVLQRTLRYIPPLAEQSGAARAVGATCNIATEDGKSK